MKALLLLLVLSGCSVSCPEYTYEEAKCQIAEKAVEMLKEDLKECRGDVSGS